MLVVEYPKSVRTFERVNGSWSIEVRDVCVRFNVAQQATEQAHFQCGMSENPRAKGSES